MAFFSRDESPPEAAPPRAAVPARNEVAPSATRVAPGSRFEGKLQGSTDVVIDGELAGDVVLGASLTVGAKGRVEGSVHARSVRVAGELHGDVVVDERLEIVPGGKLEGDVRAPRVAIAEGGFFRGHVDMGSKGGARPKGENEPTARPQQARLESAAGQASPPAKETG